MGAMIWLIFATSCNSWLDVKPKTEESAEELFSTQDGFKAALAGVYIGLSHSELYGKELTFGMIGVLGQEWGDGEDFYSGSTYDYLRNYSFDQVSTRALFDQVWSKMYESVANVNTLIQYTELKKDVLQGNHYEVIRGEALALRAFLHFDLLRMFAPCDFSDQAKAAIPYVLEPKPMIAPQLTPEKYVALALEDINAALELLKKDPIYTGQDVSGVDNGYLANRNFHLNYYAVLGLKARVCLYAGDTDVALAAAREVIAAQDGGLFPWVKTDDITTTNLNLRDRTFSSEHLFAFNAIKLEEYVKGYFREFDKLLTPRLLSGVLYDLDDYRNAIYETYSGSANVLTKFWQMESQFVNGMGLVKPKRDRMPSLRVTEMYYIAAECLKSTNLGEAGNMLNVVRLNRGLTELPDMDKEALQNELEKEYYREFIGEGQVFFYHKRMGTKIIDRANAVYVFPMPDVEVDLGQRK